MGKNNTKDKNANKIQIFMGVARLMQGDLTEDTTGDYPGVSI